MCLASHPWGIASCMVLSRGWAFTQCATLLVFGAFHPAEEANANPKVPLTGALREIRKGAIRDHDGIPTGAGREAWGDPEKPLRPQGDPEGAPKGSQKGTP